MAQSGNTPVPGELDSFLGHYKTQTTYFPPSNDGDVIGVREGIYFDGTYHRPITAYTGAATADTLSYLAANFSGLSGMAKAAGDLDPDLLVYLQQNAMPVCAALSAAAPVGTLVTLVMNTAGTGVNSLVGILPAVAVTTNPDIAIGQVQEYAQAGATQLSVRFLSKALRQRMSEALATQSITGGTSAATATLLGGGTNLVTGASTAPYVRLPSLPNLVIVINSLANNQSLTVYPPANCPGTTTAPSIAGAGTATVYPSGSTNSPAGVGIFVGNGPNWSVK